MFVEGGVEYKLYRFLKFNCGMKIETKFKLNITYIKLEGCYKYGTDYKDLISN